jgi:hypothetical protein
MDHVMAPARPDPSVWFSQVLRFTAFPTPDAQLGDVTWWLELTGGQPETRTSQPRRGALQEEGSLQRGVLTLKIEPLRIDWLMGQSTETIIQEDTLPVLGRFTDTLPEFTHLMRRWLALPSIPPMSRLALGAILLQPVDTREEGYRRLRSYLNAVQVDPESSSDLLYQINRARPSRTEIPDLRINRLSKWSVALTIRRAITAGLGGVSIATAEEIRACRLELDVNTAPDYVGQIPRDRLVELLDEFVSLGTEIVQEGDIP